jgi:predicted SAM-dependent methyltransferase
MDTKSFSLPSGPRLNLGCGPVQPAGWINIDGSHRAFLASRLNRLDRLLVRSGLIPSTEFNKQTKYRNLFKGLPYPDNSVACIYAGELWEHFEYPDASALTRESFRVLKPQGVLRVCVPDGPSFWGKYLQLYQEELSKPRDVRASKKLVQHVQLFFNDICTKRIYLGSMGHTHKWNFDEVQLIEMFEVNGFSEVERMTFHSSRIPEIADVERADFLIVEGVKT